MEKVMQALYNGDYKLNGTQYRIVLCILDNNDYGKRRGVEMPLKGLSEDIKANRIQTSRELKRLIERKIVKVVENYSSKDRYGRVLAINKPSEWIKD